MSLVYVGSLSLPGLCPSVELSLGIPSISLNASLTGSLALNASIALQPPTIALYLSALAQVQAQMTLGVSLGVPDVSFSLSDTVALSVSLNASFSLLLDLQASLSLSLSLGVGAGLYAFTYEGTGNALGADVTSAIGAGWPDGSSGSCTGIVLAGVSESALVQLPTFLNGLTFETGLNLGTKVASLGAMSKLTAAASVQGSAAISAQLAATASLAASVSVSLPTLAVDLVELAKFYISLEAQLKLAPPAIGVAVAANAKLAANIAANFNAMASLGASLSSGAAFFAYSYSGTPSGYGTALTSALASTWGDTITPTSSECVAVVFAALDATSALALTGFFGGV
jgi:hypothetical protein